LIFSAADFRDDRANAQGFHPAGIPARPPIKNAFDPATHATRRFRLAAPDGFNGSHDKRDINSSDRECPEYWVYVGGKCRRPLRGMLCAAPPGFVGPDIRIGTLAERHRRCGLDRCRGLSRTPRLNRIDTYRYLFARLSRALTSFGEGPINDASKPEVAPTPSELISQNPLPRTARRDSQIKPSAITQ
jgi:hypothetical protein